MTDAHEALVEHLQRIDAVDRAADVLRWDQETTMPPGGIDARAGELSQLASIVHERWISEETGKRIEEARSQAATEKQHALVREANWIYERRARVPEQLVEEISETTARAQAAWEQAKREDTFGVFADHLKRIVDLQRAYAEAIDPDRDPYEVLFEDHEPWLGFDRAMVVVDEVAQGVQELVDEAPEPAEQVPENALEGNWSEATQRALLEALLDELGYDYERGVVGEAEHPFSIGNVHDARIATNLREDHLLSGLTSTIHEFGHALYTQGLPVESFGTPLGGSRNLVVHESQSRLWENHVARSRPFWRLLAPRLEQHFDRPVDPEAAWRSANLVEPSLIRVDADELSYHLHIKLRLDLERQLVRGELDVHDLPERWNDGMAELLGLRPATDRDGVLQDVHWSHGSIGYFPTYTLGSALAAQTEAAIEEDVGPVGKLVAEQRFGEIVSWLRDNVHQHGCRYTTSQLVEEATGQDLGSSAFLDHARDRFARLWDEQG